MLLKTVEKEVVYQYDQQYNDEMLDDDPYGHGGYNDNVDDI